MAADGAVRATTRVLYDQGEGHPWYPPHVVLIGDRAYVNYGKVNPLSFTADHPKPFTAGNASATTGDVALNSAVQARWLASPDNLVALLKNSTSFQQNAAAAELSFTGNVPPDGLVYHATAKVFYRLYDKAPPGALVSYKIVTDRNYLPKSIELRIPFHSSIKPGQYDSTVDYLKSYPDDPFTITYSGWGKGKHITAP